MKIIAHIKDPKNINKKDLWTRCIHKYIFQLGSITWTPSIAWGLCTATSFPCKIPRLRCLGRPDKIKNKNIDTTNDLNSMSYLSERHDTDVSTSEILLGIWLAENNDVWSTHYYYVYYSHCWELRKDCHSFDEALRCCNRSAKVSLTPSYDDLSINLSIYLSVYYRKHTDLHETQCFVFAHCRHSSVTEAQVCSQLQSCALHDVTLSQYRDL